MFLGAFYENKLIGYLEFGHVMDGTDEILLYPNMEYDDTYVETLYVDKEYRGNYVGVLLIRWAIGCFDRPVFLIADNKDLVAYYEKMGFRHLGDLGMVFEPEPED